MNAESTVTKNADGSVVIRIVTERGGMHVLQKGGDMLIIGPR